MLRRSVSVQVLFVGFCWLVGGALAIAQLFSARHLGALSLLFTSAGATIYIEGCLQKMAGGWVAAYEAGRDVTRLRSTGSSH